MLKVSEYSYKLKKTIISRLQRCKVIKKVNSKPHENSWQLIVDDFRNHCNLELEALEPYKRWEWAFSILIRLNKRFPFSLLENVIPDIVCIHNDTFDDELISVLKNDILQAKYEYGLTISEMGEFAEILANNQCLTFEQALLVIEHIIKIYNYNLAYSIESWEEYLNYLNITFDKINRS